MISFHWYSIKRNFLVFAFFLVGSLVCPAVTPIDKKALEKECKQFCKKLQAEGWTAWLPTEELSTAVERYYDKLASSDDDLVTLLGVGIGKTKSIARRKAEIHARSQYALSKDGTHNAYFSSTEKSDGVHADSTTLVLGSQTTASSQVKMPMPALCVCRQLPDGNTEVQLYYLYKHQ